MGGELSLRLNGTHSWRSAAAYLNLYGPNTLFQGYSGSCAVFVKGACLLTGMSGSYTRLSTEVGWQKTLVDSLGQQWTPFIRARAEVFGINPQINGYQNQYVANFMNPNSQGLGRFMPSLGMTYRIPFIASFKKSDVLHILEPIAQIVIRPNETHIRQIPNEDAQNVIFDDSSLFELDKFSGFDRVEGGTRANVGLRYGLTLPQTGYGEFLFGRSFQLAGRNSFSTPDLVNAGLQSGLDKKASDYVARLSLATQTSLLLTAQGRFDASTLKTQQMLFSTQAVFKRLTASFGVMQVATQQTQGDPLRWGLFSSLSLSLTSHISVGGTFLAGYNRQSDSTTSNPKYKWGTTGFMLNALYRDDCTTFGVAYAAKPTENRLSNGTFKPNHTFTLSLELRTLGSMSINPNFFSSKPPLMGIIP
jgi:LPS-assembly protein